MVLESTDKYKDKRLNLAIITLDLSDIKNEKGELAYLKIFEDDYGFKISMNKEIISKEQAHKYFDKLEDTLGNGYKLHYYEVQTDEDFNGKITFKPKSEVEKNN